MRENLESLNKSIFDKLIEEGCCERCCLRYIGIKDISLYRNLALIKDKFKDVVIRDENEENPSVAKKTKLGPCIACLDLLRDTEDYKTICKDVEAEGYDAKYFTCALSLPVSLQIREKSVLLFLSHRFPAVYAMNDVSNGYHSVTLKEAWKWTYETKISDLLNMKIDFGPAQDFFIEINIKYLDDAEECSCLLKMYADIFEPRAKHPRKYGGEVFTRKSVEAALADTTYEHLKPHYPCPPAAPTVSAQYAPVSCYHNSIFVAGRYNKYSRTLSQTPWVIDGERRVESSVQELIGEIIVKAFKAGGLKFSASGREDVDVRTLGRGRPFAIELLDPHRVHIKQDEMKALQDEINENSLEKISIRDLQIVPKEELCKLKYGEEEKKKRYAALCVALTPPPPGALESLSEKINDLVLHQKTPIRVLHRRPLAERLRTIHSATAEILPTQESSGGGKVYFVLRLRTQAGTYVKEFIHGDFGRTEPSLGSLLGVEVDILALDVEEVELDWPKEVNLE